MLVFLLLIFIFYFNQLVLNIKKSQQPKLLAFFKKFGGDGGKYTKPYKPLPIKVLGFSKNNIPQNIPQFDKVTLILAAHALNAKATIKAAIG